MMNHFKRDIMEAIKLSNEGNSLNKAGGIFIHNKATMDIEIKELLIGISRVFVDCNNNLNSYIYSEKNFKAYMDLKDEGLNSHIALRNNSRFNLQYEDDEVNAEDSKANAKDSEVNERYSEIERVDISRERDDHKNILENTNEEMQKQDISYAEYDHDKDVINNDDLLNGMKETQEQVDFHEEINVEDLDFFNGYGGFSKDG